MSHASNKTLAIKMLNKFNGNIRDAAFRVGCSRRTLDRWIYRYGLWPLVTELREGTRSMSHASNKALAIEMLNKCNGNILGAAFRADRSHNTMKRWVYRYKLWPLVTELRGVGSCKKALAIEMLNKCNGNIRGAAFRAGCARGTMNRWIYRYGLWPLVTELRDRYLQRMDDEKRMSERSGR